MTDPHIQIRPIRVDDLTASRAMRLEALRSHPEAFGSDHDELAAAPESLWLERMRPSLEGRGSRLLVAEAAGELVAMTGVYRDTGAKVNHSATLWGVYVRPAWRGRRLVDRLFADALAWCAAQRVRIVRLTVVTDNAAAIRCYQRLGFAVCGIAPEVIRVGDRYHDELLMWRRV